MPGKITASYGPDGSATRCSEGAFLRLTNGEILFVFSRFTGSDNDAAPAGLAAARSADEGESWTEPEPLLDAGRFGAKNIMSVSLLRMQNGDVGLFFGVKAAPNVTRFVLARSRDEGKSFAEFKVCSLADREGYYVMNNDRAERLASGRILLPLAYHRGGYDESGDWYFDGRGAACFLYSDDDGRSWAESPDVVFAPFTGTFTGLQEPGVIELAGGTLWAYYRTDKGFQYESFSRDGGLHWTAAQPSRFTSPASPMKIRRREADGKLYAVWNPISEYNGRPLTPAGWGRTPLVYAVSGDEGLTWSEPVILEEEEGHGYCYPALFFTRDRSLLLAYCAGGPEDGSCLARLRIRKLPL